MFFVGNIVSLLCSLKRPLCGKKKKVATKAIATYYLYYTKLLL
nr:MAG TPA: hypothetical protein [Caudoviricetes sp.]